MDVLIFHAVRAMPNEARKVALRSIANQARSRILNNLFRNSTRADQTLIDEARTWQAALHWALGNMEYCEGRTKWDEPMSYEELIAWKERDVKLDPETTVRIQELVDVPLEVLVKMRAEARKQRAEKERALVPDAESLPEGDLHDFDSERLAVIRDKIIADINKARYRCLEAAMNGSERAMEVLKALKQALDALGVQPTKEEDDDDGTEDDAQTDAQV